MAERGAPIGNQNAAKAKRFYDGLSRALARKGKTVDGGLNKVCDQLVEAAVNGEQWAIKEVADRIDGRPAQSLTVAGDEDAPLVTKVLREVINPKDSDS